MNHISVVTWFQHVQVLARLLFVATLSHVRLLSIRINSNHDGYVINKQITKNVFWGIFYIFNNRSILYILPVLVKKIGSSIKASNRDLPTTRLFYNYHRWLYYSRPLNFRTDRYDPEKIRDLKQILRPKKKIRMFLVLLYIKQHHALHHEQ